MKEVKDVVDMAEAQVKEYAQSVKAKDFNNEDKIKLRNYQFIKQQKFLYDKKTIQNLLSDSLARTTNSFGDFVDKDRTNLSRVVTIYMDIDDKNTKTLKKIYFSQKEEYQIKTKLLKM